MRRAARRRAGPATPWRSSWPRCSRRLAAAPRSTFRFRVRSIDMTLGARPVAAGGPGVHLRGRMQQFQDRGDVDLTRVANLIDGHKFVWLVADAQVARAEDNRGDAARV